MRHGLVRSGMFLMAALMLAGCASREYKPLPAFIPQEMDAGAYKAKVDNFVVILDISSSMNGSYMEHRKFDVALGTVKNLNATMPDMDINGAIRTFGHHASFSKRLTEPLCPLSKYSTDTFEEKLDIISQPGGTSRLDTAIVAAGEDLKAAGGKSAMIIITDGDRMGYAPLSAARALNDEMQGNLCIYPILVGDDKAGADLLVSMAAVTACGGMIRADQLSSGNNMAEFVQMALLDVIEDADGDGVPDKYDRCPGTPPNVEVDAYGCPVDSDNDGVPDYLDNCPDTPAGVKVDEYGCPLAAKVEGAVLTEKGVYIYEEIKFDTGKSDIKTASHGVLDQIAALLVQNPDVTIEVQGHTDNTGSYDMNMKLSEERAKAVKSYLINAGVQESSLTAKGYGPDQPIASNKTAEGRSKNRRVRFVRID